MNQANAKYMIKTEQDKQNMKDLEFGFLGTSMRVHAQGMCAHPICICMHIRLET